MFLSTSGRKEQREREREKHPWLFTKHSLFYLCEAVRGLHSPLHLSLISDKALFKCLLSWPIHDWRWHLRNTSEERHGIGRVGGTSRSTRSILVWSRAINMFLLRRSCHFGDSPLLRLISQQVKGVHSRLMSSMGDHLFEWEWLKDSKKCKAATERQGESPVQRDKRKNRKALEDSEWMTNESSVHNSTQEGKSVKKRKRR